jgi:recombination protein RecA
VRRGISREGSLIDVGSSSRSSASRALVPTRATARPGKENARKFLRENPTSLTEIEKRIKEKLGIGAVLDAAVEPLPAPVDF